MKGASTSTGLMSLQLDVTTSLYSEISNSDILGSVEEITGAINLQTGEIVGKIDDATKEITGAIDGAVNEDFGYTRPAQPNTDDALNDGNALLDGMVSQIDDFTAGMADDSAQIVSNVQAVSPVVSSTFNALPAPVVAGIGGAVVLLVVRKVVGR